MIGAPGDDLQPGAISPSPSRVRSWWMRIHLYGGLVCFWYLLIFGITSLAFNHPGLLPERTGLAVEWDQAMEVPDVADPLKRGEAVQQRLDLIGWVLPWNLEPGTEALGGPAL